MMRSASPGTIGWLGIVRLGMVQFALGAIVVLVTSTFNRVLVVELGLAAALPGLLVGWHYAVQITRPRWGYGADRDGNRRLWILGGIAILALGGVGAALSVALAAVSIWAGLVAAFLAFTLIGIGVGAAGTNLLAFLAAATPPPRKAAAAAIVWIMMIVGFVITAGVAGSFLDPFTFGRLVTVTSVVAVAAIAVSALALAGMTVPARPATAIPPAGDDPQTALAASPEKSVFRAAVASVLADRDARRFTVFVFVSMLAYNAQDLILEPFAGLVHGYSPGESTKLAGVQHGGVLLGMIATAILGTVVGRSRSRFMAGWTVAGCAASALALLALAGSALFPGQVPLKPSVFALGTANGAFAVAAIGSMMALASDGEGGREGTRMGVWGAAQAIAFGLGGLIGAVAVDVARSAFGSAPPSFALVFAIEAAVFLLAAALAARAIAGPVSRLPARGRRLPFLPAEPLAQAQ